MIVIVLPMSLCPFFRYNLLDEIPKEHVSKYLGIEADVKLLFLSEYDELNSYNGTLSQAKNYISDFSVDICVGRYEFVNSKYKILKSLNGYTAYTRKDSNISWQESNISNINYEYVSDLGVFIRNYISAKIANLL